MRKLFFVSLCAVISALIFLPVSEAIHRGQSPKGPRREGAPTSARTNKKTTRKEAKSASKPGKAFQATPVEPVSITASNFAESAPVSQVAAEPRLIESDQSNEEEEAAENRTVRFVTDAAIQRLNKMSSSERSRLDQAMQSSESVLPNIPSPITSWDGISSADNFAAFGFRVAPPDTNGDVGPNHYVQQVNFLVRIWNKAGVALTPPFKLSSLFAPLGGQCAIQDAGDPLVLYDPLSDRWMLSQFAFASQTTPPYHQCIAISKTPDPTGAYYLYDFITGGTTGVNEFPDYPHLGVWPDGYYMMVHQFTNSGPFNGTGVYSFNRAKMLIGDPSANYIYFNLNLTNHPEGIGGGLFADLDGVTPPPAGAPDIFAYPTATDVGDPANGIRLFNFHADFNVPANSTFTERPESTYAAPVPVAAFSLINPSGDRDVPQPAPAATVTTSLDSISDRFMHRMQYRNQGAYETLVLSHTVGAPASTVFGTYRAAPRYYELRNGGAGYSVNEQATFSPGGSPGDRISRWMSSAAEDNQGNLAVGYSVSSGAAGGNVFPGIRYAGRLATDPPNGLFQGEATLISGSGVQTSTFNNRWGDYSALAVDPSDDCTFWYTTEYYTAASQATSTVGWLTRIGNFKFTQCTAPAMGTLSGTVTFCETGAPVSGALVTVDGTLYGATQANGTYSVTLTPGTHSVQISAAGQNCATSAAANVNITNGGAATYNTCLTGTPKPAVNSTTISGGNGDGIINLDECNSLVVNLGNLGCAGATGVSAVLSSTTPGVTVEQPNSPYPDIAIGGSGGNTVPFEFSTSPSFVCGTTINFALTLTTNQGVFVLNFSKATCTTPPVNVSGSITAGDPTQTGRLNRFAPPSSCGVAKANPGLFAATGARHYDTYSFTNSGNGPACVTVSLTSGCGTRIFGVSYLGSFNPANLTQNYLGDFGASSAGTATWSVDIPAGQTMVLVVHEVNPNALCASYTATVSGLLSSTDGGGECQECVVSVPSNITVPNDPGDCGAIVNFPASTSTGSCGVLTTSPASGSFFPVGTTTVTTTSTSGASASFTVTVNDTEPPTVSALTVDKPVLWPPNHQMIPITVNYSSSDNCGGTCVLSATSSEPDNGLGDGDTANDIQIVDDHHILLRAERSGKGNGRTYTIRATCTDAAGNSVVSGPVTVVVPRDMRR